MAAFQADGAEASDRRVRIRNRDFSVTSDGQKVPLAIPSSEARSLETRGAEVRPLPPAVLDARTGDAAVGAVEMCSEAVGFDFDRSLQKRSSAVVKKRVQKKPHSNSCGSEMKATATVGVQQQTGAEFGDSGRFQDSIDKRDSIGQPLASTPKEAGLASLNHRIVEDHDRVLKELLGKRTSPEGLESPPPLISDANPSRKELTLGILSDTVLLRDTKEKKVYADHEVVEPKGGRISASHSMPQLFGGRSLPVSWEPPVEGKGKGIKGREETFETQVLNRLERVSTRLSSAMSDSWDEQRTPEEQEEEEMSGELQSKEQTPDQYEGEIAYVLSAGSSFNSVQFEFIRHSHGAIIPYAKES